MKSFKNIIAIIAIACVANTMVNASYKPVKIQDTRLRGGISSVDAVTNEPVELGYQLYGQSYEKNYPNQNNSKKPALIRPSYYNPQKNY